MVHRIKNIRSCSAHSFTQYTGMSRFCVDSGVGILFAVDSRSVPSDGLVIAINGHVVHRRSLLLAVSLSFHSPHRKSGHQLVQEKAIPAVIDALQHFVRVLEALDLTTKDQEAVERFASMVQRISKNISLVEG